jgi:hypothetical protein
MSARVAWLLAAAMLAGSPAAWAQGSPTAAPAAKPAPKSDPAGPAKKDDPKKPPAKPGDTTNKDPKPTGNGGALPQGHPPVGDPGLPAGHPPVEDDEGQPARPQQKRNPHGGGAGGEGFFQPPEDGAVDDPSLPVGTVVVTLTDAQERPVPDAPLVLGILHNTVAKGESSDRVARPTGEDGTARFDELAIGGGVSYRVTVANGPAVFEAPPFTLGDKSGKRVTLHAYEVTRSAADIRAGMWGVVYLQLREDAISVEQHMTILNVDPVAWVPEGAVIGLPEDYKAFVKPDGMGGAVRWDEVKGEGAALSGTITPGQHESGFRYQVPLSGDGKQTIKIRLPAKVFQIGVMAEASKSMGLEVSGFPAPQRTERNGRKVLVTKKQSAGPGDEMRTVEITLSGLPVAGPGRWIALSLGAAVAFAGAFYLSKRKNDGELPEDARLDLEEAKKALLDEIVALERAHKSGEVGPKTYARVRTALLDALARIVHRLEAGRPRKAAQAYR